MSNKKLTVLVVTAIYPPYSGGASTYYNTLFKSLRDKVNLLVLTSSHPTKPLIETDINAKVFRIIPNLRGPTWIRRAIISSITFIALLILHLVHKPQIIHSHCGSEIIAFAAGLYSLIFRVSIVKDLRGLWVVQNEPYLVKLGKVKKYLAVGKKTKKELLSVGIPERKIVVLPVIGSPVAEEVAKSKIGNKNIDEIRVLFVGQLIKTKGIYTLLSAFKRVVKTCKNVSLTCIGNGVAKDDCEKFISENFLEEKIHLLGDLEYDDTLNRIGESDFVVLPSETEGMPRVILEAFAFEKPVIVSTVGEIPEVIKNRENGILINPGNTEVLAKEIIKLASDKNLRRKLGQNGKKFLDELPPVDIIANQIVEIYEEPDS